MADVRAPIELLLSLTRTRRIKRVFKDVGDNQQDRAGHVRATTAVKDKEREQGIDKERQLREGETERESPKNELVCACHIPESLNVPSS